jgi:two-component system, sensor histidine kinase
MTIRSHLALLATGAMLPVLAFAVLVSAMLVSRDSATVQRAALDRARAMMTAVDAQMRGSVATVAALAASSALATDDLPSFHAEARRVLAGQSSWANISLARASGEKIVDASTPVGDPPPPVADPTSVERVRRTLTPVIGDIDAIASGNPGIRVRVPVLRDGAVAYVLTAVVRPDSFEELIRQQRLPEGWISGIVDASGRFVARVPQRPVGQLASRSIGRGDPRATTIRADVREVTEVAAALQEAATAVHEREALVRREKDVLQAADRAKDEFIAVLSHELRNPLAALTSAARIVRIANPANAAAIDACAVIERQTQHMSRMVEDLLDVSRIIMGKANLMLETFDLGQLAGTTIAAWRASGWFGDHPLSVHVQPAWVHADRTRIEQALSNLLDNAVKFTPPGTPIAVSVVHEAQTVVMSVADQGPGIAQDLLPRVFDVFVQAEQGIGRKQGGMGLGLALVKRFVEAQGGTVAVASSGNGSGATFTVRLPAAQPVSTTRASPSEAQRATPRSILLVEDNRDARDMLRQLLEMEGHDVLDAADGTTGIALAVEHRPDIAIVDIGLPDVDGYEVARRIRAASGKRMRLVALTGYGQPEDVRRALAAGFDIHLVKPVSAQRLEEATAAPGDARVARVYEE